MYICTSHSYVLRELLKNKGILVSCMYFIIYYLETHKETIPCFLYYERSRLVLMCTSQYCVLIMMKDLFRTIYH